MSLYSDEPETLVLIQFTDIDDASYCEQFIENFKTIEIESKNPIIQIGDRIYTGEYTNNIGTYLFFEQLQQQESTTAQGEQSILPSSDSLFSSELRPNSSESAPLETNQKNSATRISQTQPDLADPVARSAKTGKEQTSSESTAASLQSSSYKFAGKTYKKLVLSRLFVEEKKAH